MNDAATAEPHGPLTRLPPIVGGLLALVLAFLALRPIASPDTWWHLSMGRATWEAGSVSYPDPVSLAAAPEYVNIVWLFDVPLYLLYQAGGLVAVNLLIAVLAALSFLACWLLAKDVVGPSGRWTALLVAALGAAGAHLRFVPRPQALFLVLLPLVIWLARRAARSSGRSLAVYAVVLAGCVAVWAQAHASVVIAPAVVLAAAVPWTVGPGATIGTRRPIGRSPGHVLAFLAVAVMPLLGPAGPQLLVRVLAHRESYAVRHIIEMQPMRLEWWLAPTRDVLFAEVLAVICVWGLVRCRRLEIGPAALALLGLALTWNTNRFAAAWAILLLPLAASVLRMSAPAAESRRRVAAALLVTVTVPLVLALGSEAPAFRAEPSFPAGVARVLRSLDVHGPIQNSYNAGGYLGWELYGRVRVLIDSRSQMLFGDEEIYAANRVLAEPAIFERLDSVHGFRAAVVPRHEALCRALEADEGWRPVWIDDTDAVFLPATEAAAGGLRRLAACAVPSQVRRCRESEAPGEFLDEVEALLRLTPGEPFLGRLGTLLSLQCAEPANVGPARLNAFLEAAAAAPEHPDFVWITGLVLFGRGDVEHALVVLAQLPSKHVPGQALRLHLLRQLGRAAAVRGIAREQLELLDDVAPPNLHEHLAWACEETGEQDCAVRHALRAALVGYPEARSQLARYREMGWIPERLATLASAALAGEPP